MMSTCDLSLLRMRQFLADCLKVVGCCCCCCCCCCCWWCLHRCGCRSCRNRCAVCDKASGVALGCWCRNTYLHHCWPLWFYTSLFQGGGLHCPLPRTSGLLYVAVVAGPAAAAAAAADAAASQYLDGLLWFVSTVSTELPGSIGYMPLRRE